MRDQLGLIADSAEQLEYQRRVPNIDVGTEVVALWFSNSYFPEDSSFRSHFSSEELKELSRFTSEFERRRSALPKWKPIEEWLQSEPWQEVMQLARLTLDLLHG